VRRLLTVLVVILAVAALAWASDKAAAPEWAMNATIIEACSCPMFCQCYFAGEPAGHHEDGKQSHYCLFNNAYKVNSGHYAGTKLDGAMFWIAGDLGADFSQGNTNWAVATFPPSVTPAQREGIAAILGYVYPVKWSSFTVGQDAAMEWSASMDRAVAKLDGGKVAEVVLTNQVNHNEPGQAVIKNLRYFGVPRNDGFVLMPNEVEAYRVGDKAFEYKGTNGFMITFDINSRDVAPATAGK
jgi:uncharacterized protein DUF1326